MSSTPHVIAPAQRRHRGHTYEQLACDYLSGQGLEFIEANYLCRGGEIDLIMRDGHTLVFVEVRFRSSSTFVDPILSINQRKQHKVRRTALTYMKHRFGSTQLACRIDVVGITPDPNGELVFRWIKNAIGG